MRWRTWRESKAAVLQFGLQFGLLMILFYGLVLLPGYERVLSAYLEISARLSGVLLNWLGQECHVAGATIQSARFAISVRKGCDAIEPAWFFCAAVLSFPARWRRKGAGILFGSAVLQGLNLVRIVSLYLIGRRFPPYFNIAHAEIWPVVFIVAAMVLWIRWIGWARGDDELES